jgi:hypothetical protein
MFAPTLFAPLGADLMQNQRLSPYLTISGSAAASACAPDH